MLNDSLEKEVKHFFIVGVRSEGSVDNSIYYDVANAISITVNGTLNKEKISQHLLTIMVSWLGVYLLQ